MDLLMNQVKDGDTKAMIKMAKLLYIDDKEKALNLINQAIILGNRDALFINAAIDAYYDDYQSAMSYLKMMRSDSSLYLEGLIYLYKNNLANAFACFSESKSSYSNEFIRMITKIREILTNNDLSINENLMNYLIDNKNNYQNDDFDYLMLFLKKNDVKSEIMRFVKSVLI